MFGKSMWKKCRLFDCNVATLRYILSYSSKRVHRDLVHDCACLRGSCCEGRCQYRPWICIAGTCSCACRHLHHDVLPIPVREGMVTFNEYSGLLLLPRVRYRCKCMTGGTATLHGFGWQDCTGSKVGLCESEPRNELLTATLLFATGMGFWEKCHRQAQIHRRRLSLVEKCQSFYHPQSTSRKCFVRRTPGGVARCLICLTLYMAMARTKRKTCQDSGEFWNFEIYSCRRFQFWCITG